VNQLRVLPDGAADRCAALRCLVEEGRCMVPDGKTYGELAHRWVATMGPRTSAAARAVRVAELLAEADVRDLKCCDWEELAVGDAIEQNENVERGKKLSTGTRDPQDMLRILGMGPMREALVEDLSNVYRQAGPYVKRKHFETVVRSITDSARVRDPGDTDYVAGDVMPYNQLRAQNMKGVKDVPVDDALGAWLAEDVPGIMPETTLTEEDVEILKQQGWSKVKANPAPVDFEPVLKGINQVPLHRRDWLSQMAFRRLKDAVKQGVPEGWQSELHETNPIPGVVYGAEFGMGKFAGENADGDFEEVLARHLSDAGYDV